MIVKEENLRLCKWQHPLLEQNLGILSNPRKKSTDNRVKILRGYMNHPGYVFI